MKRFVGLTFGLLLLSACSVEKDNVNTISKESSTKFTTTETSITTSSTSTSQASQSSTAQAKSAPKKPMDVIYNRTFQTFMGLGQINIAFNPNGIYRCGYIFGGRPHSTEVYYDGKYTVSDDGTIHLSQLSQHQLIMADQANTYIKDTTDAPVNDYKFRVAHNTVFVTHNGEEVEMDNLGTEPTYVYYDWVKKNYKQVTDNTAVEEYPQQEQAETNLSLREMNNIIYDHTFVARYKGNEFYAAFNPDGTLRTCYKYQAKDNSSAREVFYDSQFEMKRNGYVSYSQESGKVLVMTAFDSKKYTDETFAYLDSFIYHLRGDELYVYVPGVGDLKMEDLGTQPTYNYYDYAKKNYQKVD